MKGSGCGSVGRAVTRYAVWIQSPEKNIMNTFTVQCWKDENEEKEAGNLTLKIVYDTGFWTITGSTIGSMLRTGNARMLGIRSTTTPMPWPPRRGPPASEGSDGRTTREKFVPVLITNLISRSRKSRKAESQNWRDFALGKTHLRDWK